MSKPRRFDWLFRPQLADADLPLSAEVRFAEAMAQLPAVERSALALSEIGGLDVSEIAERLGTDPAVVGKLLARARESVRTQIGARGRRGLIAALPFQNWWQTGSSAPVVRAAGIVAAAVVGPTVAIGGAAAEGPRATVASPAASQIRAIEPAARGAVAVHRTSAAAAAAGVVGPRPLLETVSVAARPPVSPGTRRDRDRDVAVASPQPLSSPEPAAPTVAPDAPPAPPSAASPGPVVETVPLLAGVESAPKPVEPPLELPPLPAEVVPVPELPPLPPVTEQLP